MSAIPAFRRLRQEEYEFKATLGYIKSSGEKKRVNKKASQTHTII
jgi:hypothetical protein